MKRTILFTLFSFLVLSGCSGDANLSGPASDISESTQGVNHKNTIGMDCFFKYEVTKSAVINQYIMWEMVIYGSANSWERFECNVEYIM